MSTLEIVFGGTPPQFIDDTNLADGQNTQPATAGIIAKEIGLVNQLAHAGHPVFTWAPSRGGAQIAGATEITSCFRQVYMAANKGAASESGEVFSGAHSIEPVVGYQTGQGVDVTIGTTTAHAYWNVSTFASALDCPNTTSLLPFSSSYGYSTVPVQVVIGGVTSNWPSPMAGAFWQNPENAVDSAKASTAGHVDVVQKGEIIATRGTGVEQLTSLANVFRDTWFHQRPQGGWSTALPGLVDPDTSAIRGVHFTTSSQQYRYVFDQTYGTTGTTITATTPAITVPLHHSGGGISTQVRVYVFAYAAMSGATNTGTLATANKNGSGTMTAPTALTHGPTISGTTFAWYPTLATWNATTAPYFLAYTNSAFDRVALCAKSSGATDHVIVGAFTFVVAPATS